MSAADSEQKTGPSLSPRPYSLMSKPIGPRCNISCTYCYYLEKADLFPDVKKFQMSDDVLETFVRDHIAASLEAGQKEIVFAWQGGEPTMLGVSFFEKAIVLQEKYKSDGVTIQNSFQTNGMLLDDNWGPFLKDHDFLIGISIDGPQKIHNTYRRDRAGRGSFEAVMRGLEILQKYGVEHNSLTVVHRENGIRGKEVYLFLKSLGIEYMQFIPIVERSRDGDVLASAPQSEEDPDIPVMSWSVTPRVYGKFLCDVFDTWYKKDIGSVFIQHFDIMLGCWLGYPSSLCVYAETCGYGPALEHNGNLYACDHYVYDDYLLGNIMDKPIRELVWSDEMKQFGLDKKEKLTGQCKACPFLFACNGGCPKHRFARSKDGEEGHNYFCQSYMMFLKHAGERIEKMAQMVRQGRMAADVHAK